MNPSKTNDDELNAIQNINKIIHEPARLLIMASPLRRRKRRLSFPAAPNRANVGQHILTHAQAGECRLRRGGEGVHRQETSHDTETHR
jgi:hypothetical protein